MIRPLAGATAAALAVAALGGCTSSAGTSAGGGGTTVPSTPATSAPSTPSTTTTAAPSSTAPSGHSMTAIAPIRPLTCATLPHALGRFAKGGRLPSGVPLPQAVPTLTCTGANGAVGVVWSTIAEAQYRQELTQTGWRASSPAAVFTKAHAPRTILLTTVHGDLVAVYRRR